MQAPKERISGKEMEGDPLLFCAAGIFESGFAGA